MADVKISELPVATAIASPDVAPVVQGGVTKQANVGLFAGLSGNIANQQVAFGNGTSIMGSDNFKWDGGVLLLQDDSSLHNLFVGFQENPFGPISGTHNTGLGVDVMDTLTTGNDNVAIGFNAGSTFDTASENVCVGSGAFAENNSSFTVVIGSGAIADADSTIAIGESARASGADSIAIGQSSHALADNSMVLGAFGRITDIYCGFRTSNSTATATVHADIFTARTGFIGDGSQIIFPDSDPHISGAGYWSGGVLTRSNG